MPSSKLHTVTDGGMMTELHTPLFGTLCTGYTLDKTTCYMESRAGLNVYNGGGNSKHTRGYNTDMNKVQQTHRSPKCVISLDKTPTVV